MEPQPTPSKRFDFPALTDEEAAAAKKKREKIIEEIRERIDAQGVYQKDSHVLYPHEVRALPDDQKKAIAETIVAWRNVPENKGFLETLDLDRVLEYIERNEVFVYIANGELLACARLHPDIGHQVDGRGRVVFGMAMKRPVSCTTTGNPEAPSAFKHVAQARLALCAARFPHLRPRTFISRENTRNIEYHLRTLGLEEIKPKDLSKPYSPINIKLNQLVEPLIGIKLPNEVMCAYTGKSISETATSQDT